MWDLHTTLLQSLITLNVTEKTQDKDKEQGSLGSFPGLLLKQAPSLALLLHIERGTINNPFPGPCTLLTMRRGSVFESTVESEI